MSDVVLKVFLQTKLSPLLDTLSDAMLKSFLQTKLYPPFHTMFSSII